MAAPTITNVNDAWAPNFGINDFLWHVNNYGPSYSFAQSIIDNPNADAQQRQLAENFLALYGPYANTIWGMVQWADLSSLWDLGNIFAPYAKTKTWQTTAAWVNAMQQWAIGYENDVTQQLNQLAAQYGTNKAQLLADIKSWAEAQKKWIQAGAQEQQVLAGWLTTARWAGSKWLAANAIAQIQNAATTQKTAVDTASMDKAIAAQSLYEQLAQQLFTQYKDTKEKWTLDTLAKTMETLNNINTYISTYGTPK